MSNNKTILSLLFVGLIFCMSAFAGDDKAKNKSDKNNPATEIEWLPYDEGLAKAKREGKHLFVDFTTKWCGYCKKMERTTFKEPEIISMLANNFIAVKVDGDSKNELDIDGYIISERNLTTKDFKVRGYPTFWFLDPAGTKLGAVSGYQPATNLKNYLEFVKDKKYEEESKDDQSQDGDNENDNKNDKK